MRKFGSLVAAGAMLLSSTAAFADEGALPSAGPADVHEARILGLSPATFAITSAIVVTVVVATIVSSNSTNHT